MGQGRRTGQIVDGDKIDLGIAERGPQNIAANAAEAVDTNLNCHMCLLLCSRCGCGLELVLVCSEPDAFGVWEPPSGQFHQTLDRSIVGSGDEIKTHFPCVLRELSRTWSLPFPIQDRM
jgi:hypothetical protein